MAYPCLVTQLQRTVNDATLPMLNDSVTTYTITWLDWDGTVLKTDTVYQGATPSYGGTPTRAADSEYTYTFSGWSPSVVPANGNASYTAQYTASEIGAETYTVTWKNWDGTTLRTDTVDAGEIPAYNGTPTRPADAQYTYTFSGWSPQIVAAAGNATYTAQYTATEISSADIVASGSAGENATWTLDSDGLLTISGTGPMDENDGNDSNAWGWHPYRNQITSVVVGGGITNIGAYAFTNCGALTAIAIPETVTSIEPWAFAHCSSLESVTLPSSLEVIENSSFYGCVKLASITIPANVRTIGEAAFWYCPAHQDIFVDEQNEKYASVGGVLFNKTLTEIVIFPTGRTGSYVMPSQTTTIGPYAFSSTQISTVAIPASVTSIVYRAFYGGSVTDIYYSGTQAQWAEITIGDNAIGSNVTIHYSGE